MSITSQAFATLLLTWNIYVLTTLITIILKYILHNPQNFKLYIYDSLNGTNVIILYSNLQLLIKNLSSTFSYLSDHFENMSFKMKKKIIFFHISIYK